MEERGREEVEKTSQKGAKRLDPHTVTAAGQTTTQWARDSIKTHFQPQSKQWEHHGCIFLTCKHRPLRGPYPLCLIVSPPPSSVK